MGQLTIRLADEQLAALRQYAARQRTPVAHLLSDYIDYLPDGGRPVVSLLGTITVSELAEMAERGGAFDWLTSEPDLYSLEDGEPV